MVSCLGTCVAAYDVNNRRIQLDESRSTGARAGALLPELAHFFMHTLWMPSFKEIEEIEAESATYIVLRALDCEYLVPPEDSQFSFNYIAYWTRSYDPNEILLLRRHRIQQGAITLVGLLHSRAMVLVEDE